MKFEHPPKPQETEQKPKYIIEGRELDRDDILQEAALILESNPRFPDSRNEKANHLRAKIALREALRKHGMENYFIEKLDGQISRDAYEILDLFKK